MQQAATHQFHSAAFVRSVAALLSGTMLAQVLAYAARPALTRLFTPEAFGILGVFVATVTLINTASTLRYEDAIMLPEKEDEASILLVLSSLILLGITILSAALMIWRDAVTAALGQPALAPYLTFVPLGVLAIGCMRLGEVWESRRHRFRQVSLSRIAQQTAALPIQLGYGIAGWGTGGLIIGTVAGWLSSSAVLSVDAARAGARALRTFDPGRLKRLARRYVDFPRFTLPSTLLNAASGQLPAFLLLYFFDPATVGLYALAYGTLSVPAGLIGASVSQVFFASAANARRTGDIAPLTREVVQRLVALGLFPMVVIAITAPHLFAFIFGSAWREAGIFAQYLIPWSFFAFVASPLTRLFDVLERQRGELVYNAALFAVRAAALLVGCLVHDPMLAVALFGISGALMWGGLTLWLIHMSGAPLASFFRTAARQLFLVLPVAALLIAAIFVVPGDGWITFIALLVVAAHAGWTLLLAPNRPLSSRL